MKKLLLWSAVLYLSGTVPDLGYTIINGKIVPIKNSNLIVKVYKNRVLVTAK